MTRILLWNALLFALPFALVWGWHLIIGLTQPTLASKWLWARTALCGALLVLASLIGWRFLLGDSPQSQYVPPIFKDGKVIPGHFE